jgi:hypothetical protein
MEKILLLLFYMLQRHSQVFLLLYIYKRYIIICSWYSVKKTRTKNLDRDGGSGRLNDCSEFTQRIGTRSWQTHWFQRSTFRGDSSGSILTGCGLKGRGVGFCGRHYFHASTRTRPTLRLGPFCPGWSGWSVELITRRFTFSVEMTNSQSHNCTN